MGVFSHKKNATNLVCSVLKDCENGHLQKVLGDSLSYVHTAHGLDLQEANLHQVCIKPVKRIEFEIVNHNTFHPQWLDSYNKWNINIEGALWESVNIERGIVGLDYMSIPQKIASGLQGGVLQRWGMMHIFDTIQQGETNNIIKVLSKIK
jgi:hypothetical protein